MEEHHRFVSKEIEFLRKQLLSYYAKNKRDLPWRNLATTLEDDSQRAYSVWVSEIMLQQTQVATVIEYYNKWINRWPTISDLSKATLEEVNEMWSGLGYYARGRRLHEGAQKLAKLRGKKSCVMPQTARDLMKELPGVGRYTAGAISSIAYNEVTGVVDGNVIRVLSRLRMIGADMSSQTAFELFWELANTVVDPEKPGDFNQSMMELGALICTPKSPKCSICPVKKICKAYRRQSICGSKTYRKITDAFSKSEEAKGQHYFGFETDDDESNGDKAINQTGIVEGKGDGDGTDGDGTGEDVISADEEDGTLEDDFNLTDIEDFPDCKFCLAPDEPWDSQLGVMNYPRKAKKKPPGAEKFISLIIEHNNTFLFSQRPDKGLLASMWEYPLTKIEKENKEVIESSIIRKEMKRRFSFNDLDNLKFCGEVNHIFSHKFHVYRVYHATLSDVSETVEDTDGRKVLWMSRDEANKSAITSAIKKIMAVKDCCKKGKRKRQSEVKVSKGQKTLDNMLTKKTKN